MCVIATRGKRSPVSWIISSRIQRHLTGDFFVAMLLAMTCLLILSSCAPTPIPPAPTEVVDVYATFAAQPWLNELYTCASETSVVINLTDPGSAEISLRIGEPEHLATPAYQIDTEEVLVVTNRQSPVQDLSLDEARALFAGQGDSSVQVWVYASGEDVQQVFDQFVMQGRSVTSSARLAASPQQMSDMLVNESNAVGILPQHWKTGDARDVYSMGEVPVLAITPNEPQGKIKQLLGCLQN